jgi:tRNA dimethylallyltransferase
MAQVVLVNLSERSALPIVVGGTHYYVEALLFHRPADEERDPNPLPHSQRPIKVGESLTELDPYLQLQQIDPLAATTIHPNDSRRIQKALSNRQQVHANLTQLSLSLP